jgi:hypothetical protein
MKSKKVSKAASASELSGVAAAASAIAGASHHMAAEEASPVNRASASVRFMDSREDAAPPPPQQSLARNMPRSAMPQHSGSRGGYDGGSRVGRGRGRGRGGSQGSRGFAEQRGEQDDLLQSISCTTLLRKKEAVGAGPTVPVTEVAQLFNSLVSKDNWAEEGEESSDGDDDLWCSGGEMMEKEREVADKADARAAARAVVQLGVGLEGGITLPMLGVEEDGAAVELIGPVKASPLRLYVGGHLETSRNMLAARIPLNTSVKQRRLTLVVTWAEQGKVRVRLCDAVSDRQFVSTTVDVRLPLTTMQEGAPDVGVLRRARQQLCQTRVKPTLASGPASPPCAFMEGKALNYFRTAVRKAGKGSYLFGRVPNGSVWLVFMPLEADASPKDVMMMQQNGAFVVPRRGDVVASLAALAQALYLPEVGSGDRLYKDGLRGPPLRDLVPAGTLPLPGAEPALSEEDEEVGSYALAPAVLGVSGPGVSGPGVSGLASAKHSMKTSGTLEKTAAELEAEHVAREAQVRRERRQALARAVALPFLCGAPQGCSVGMKLLAQLGHNLEDSAALIKLAEEEAKAGPANVLPSLNAAGAMEAVGRVVASVGLPSLGKNAAAELGTLFPALLRVLISQLAKVCQCEGMGNTLSYIDNFVYFLFFFFSSQSFF